MNIPEDVLVTTRNLPPIFRRDIEGRMWLDTSRGKWTCIDSIVGVHAGDGRGYPLTIDTVSRHGVPICPVAAICLMWYLGFSNDDIDLVVPKTCWEPNEGEPTTDVFQIDEEHDRRLVTTRNWLLAEAIWQKEAGEYSRVSRGVGSE